MELTDITCADLSTMKRTSVETLITIKVYPVCCSAGSGFVALEGPVLQF